MCSFLTHKEATQYLSSEQYSCLMHEINQLNPKTDLISVRGEEINGNVDYSISVLPINTDVSKYHWTYQEVISWLKGE